MMNRMGLLPLALLGLAACADSAPLATVDNGNAAPLHAAAANGIEGEYVVVLRDGAHPTSVAAVAGVEPRHVYTAALNGFAASLNTGQLTALRHHPEVLYVEQDQVLEAKQSAVPWNLDRIDQRYLPLNGQYVANTLAANVTAYIIDTGILTAHTQFGGRAAVGFDATGGNGQDCNGHGTHVAGVVGGSTYGVAKGVRLRAVRVLNCSGSGSTSGIIAGVDWVRVNHVKPAVANLSIGGGYSASLNTAVNNMANAGVYTAVASGSSASNACNYSPSSASQVTTVAPSTPTDAAASSANFGSCVHLYAPGYKILSAWHTSTTATATISGSSLAAPHAAGVGALYLAYNPSASNTTVRSWIIGNATVGVLSGVPPGTPNRLLYKSTL
jgi:subtilisin family serine protease